MLTLHLLDELGLVLHLPLNLIAMVPVVRKGGIDVRHRQMLEARNDLVGRKPLQFMPDVDVLNTNARAGDARLPPQTFGLLTMCSTLVRFMFES